eukprot:6200308-Pleurochrysis_carterae.AAC.1
MHTRLRSFVLARVRDLGLSIGSAQICSQTQHRFHACKTGQWILSRSTESVKRARSCRFAHFHPAPPLPTISCYTDLANERVELTRLWSLPASGAGQLSVHRVDCAHATRQSAKGAGKGTGARCC